LVHICQPAPDKFGTKHVIVTYSPNPSCVPNSISGVLLDVINCAHFCWLVQGYRLTWGLKFAYFYINWMSPLSLSDC